jgi:hypothetical protein
VIKGARPGLFALLFIASAQVALACGVCFEKPERTVADRVLSADAVLVAREDPDRPYRFAPVTFLSGAAQNAQIPFLVDSTTKRRLDTHPEDGVLILREGDDWSRAGYATEIWRSTAARILALGPDWQNDQKARFSFFESLLDEPDSFVRKVAIDELSRAPYDLLRRMTQPIEGEVARKSLSDRTQVPWQSFYILMLGLSDRAEDHALVRQRIASAARLGSSPHLEAWATALVEIDGTEGLTLLVEAWLQAPHVSADALRSVIAALTAHARIGDPAMKGAVLEALAPLPQRHPEVVGTVAAAFGEIGDFSQAGAIRNVVGGLPVKEMRRIDPSELFAASSYVYQARKRTLASVDPLQDY